MKTSPLRLGYTQQPDGSYSKRIEFDVPGKPGVILVKHLRRDCKGQLLASKRGEWMREKSKTTI